MWMGLPPPLPTWQKETCALPASVLAGVASCSRQPRAVPTVEEEKGEEGLEQEHADRGNGADRAADRIPPTGESLLAECVGIGSQPDDCPANNFVDRADFFSF